MANSDSDDDVLDDADFDNGSDAEDDIDDDILGALEGDLAAAAAEEGTEGYDDSDTDDSDGGSDDEDMEEAVPIAQALVPQVPEDAHSASASSSKLPTPQRDSPPPRSFTPPPVQRSLSPAHLRKEKLLSELVWPKSYTVEAVAAIPQPVPTHALASTVCMSHLLTGSDDGYIRDYDVFSAVNGKVFLTAPQRHHCGVIEGILKAVPIRSWWENPSDASSLNGMADDQSLASVYSLLMQSDGLWALSGSEHGNINLFTVRHDPGRLCHVMNAHRGPVSAMSMAHDEKGFFSAGWDGEALQWDLNTGQVVRSFTAHGAQQAAIAVRPLMSDFRGPRWSPPPPEAAVHASVNISENIKSEPFHQVDTTVSQTDYTMISQDDDAKSDTSFDPLFDGELDADGEPDNDGHSNAALRQQPTNPYGHPGAPAMPSYGSYQNGGITPAPAPVPAPVAAPQPHPRSVSTSTVAPPKNAPPILDPVTYSMFSPDILMTASVDGQIILWDQRVHSPGQGVGRLWVAEKTPPWLVSACWSADGGQIYAGRRNGTIDVWDVRQMGRSARNNPRVLKVLRNPVSSGVVSCVVAFPDGRHLACASNDNIRLWNVAEAGEPDAWGKMKSGVQFKIIPGHHGGFISQMLVDPAARFMVSASSNRGWHGESTRTVFVHEIKHLR